MGLQFCKPIFFLSIISENGDLPVATYSRRCFLQQLKICAHSRAEYLYLKSSYILSIVAFYLYFGQNTAIIRKERVVWMQL